MPELRQSLLFVSVRPRAQMEKIYNIFLLTLPVSMPPAHAFHTLLCSAPGFRSKAHICQYVNLEQLILRILEHQSYLITECTHIIPILVNVLSIIIQRTVRCFHKSVQMLDQSRFPRSGMTDDSHKFTVWNLQANVFECMFSYAVPGLYT